MGNKVAGVGLQWLVVRPFTDREWSAVMSAAKRIVQAGAQAVHGPAGRGLAVVRRQVIALNGDLTMRRAGEAFTLMPVGPGTWESCKTYGLPYGDVARAILLAARRVAPDALSLRLGETSMAARLASAKMADMSRHACIVATGTWDGRRVLIKNRDRNYQPELVVIRELRDGVEVCYVKDVGTGWCEGLNEHGIGMVNAALMVGRDEAEKKVVNEVGKKSKDGERILHALAAKTLADATERAMTFKGGIKGHTLIADKDQAFSIEMTSKHEGVKTRLQNDRKHVRTNHGFTYDDAGYTDGDDYVSSVSRRDQAIKALRDVSKVDDLAPELMARRKKDRSDPNNMVRNTDNMSTTAQILLNLTDRELVLYLIQATWKGVEDKLPKGHAPKIKLRVLKYVGDGSDTKPVKNLED